MTTDDVKSILRTPYKPLALTALSYVNLEDRELNLLVLRFMRGMTQEEAAEYMHYTPRAVQKWEKESLEKCRKAWEHLVFIQEILKAASG